MISSPSFPITESLVSLSKPCQFFSNLKFSKPLFESVPSISLRLIDVDKRAFKYGLKLFSLLALYLSKSGM